MTKQEALSIYEAWQEKMNSYRLLLTTASFDNETVAPRAGTDYRNRALSFISGEAHDIATDDQVYEAIVTLLNDCDDEDLKRRLTLDKKGLDSERVMSKEEAVAFSLAQMESFDSWQNAKQNNDYASFEPHLLKLIDYLKLFASRRNPEANPYDVYLDDYEEGMSREDYDEFFKVVKEELAPIVKAVAEKKDYIDTSFLHKYYDEDRQSKFAKDVLKFINFDKSWGYMGVSEHPFTSNFSLNDVRITTHYDENDVSSSLYSIIHEVGHAYFMHQVKEEYGGTSLETDISSGMHESQSRFLENYVGRRESFLANVYPQLQSYYPDELGNISLNDFYKAVNASAPSLIRTQADELTYPFHVLIRYEIEKMIFDGSYEGKLNELWKDKYKEYLGVEVPNDSLGILQDVHWSGGSFGYFPTYALGSAMGAQLLNTMEKTIDIDAELNKGNFKVITDWLKENLQQYGARYSFKETVKRICNEDFDPHYYTDYLKKKYSELYNL